MSPTQTQTQAQIHAQTQAQPHRSSHRRVVARALAAGVSALLAVTLLAGPAAAWAPPSGPVFNNPYGSYAAKWRIVKTIQKSVRQARKGSTIMMSMFLMDGRTSADQLIAARNRGVKVQLVFDGDDARSAMARRMARKFNKDNRPKQPIPQRWGKDGSFVVFCSGSCRGGSASRNNNHTKFYTFSRTGSARNVVMVSSSNLNAGGATRGFNDLWISKGRAGMYADYATIHREMSRDRPAGNRYRQRTHGNLVSRFYPKPKGGDPVLGDLGKIRCRGVQGGAGRKGRTAVNVSMFAWNGDRGVKIARKLVRLGRDGCHVSVVYGAPSKKVRLVLSRAARNRVIKLWDSRRDRNGDGTFDVRTHGKYFLVNGRYGADRSSWRVHTGSQNWGRGTLRGGDENTLTIAGRGAYRKYVKNWDFVVSRHSRRIR